MNETALAVRREWSRGQRWKNDVLYVGARALFAVLPLVPAAGLRAAGSAVGQVLERVHGSWRRVAARNLALALPELEDRERSALRRRSFVNLGSWLGETLAAASGRPAATLPFAGDSAEVLAATLAEKRGVVIASAHLGPWERMGASLVTHGVPLLTITRGAYDPRLDFAYRRVRGGAGVLTVERGRPGATARIVRTLRQGGVLGVPMDLATRARSIDARFLGHPAASPVGPARLALAGRAAVLVCTVGRDGSGLALHVSRVDTTGLDATALTQRINDVLSDRIRAFPEGWVWMHDRFAAPSRDLTAEVA